MGSTWDQRTVPVMKPAFMVWILLLLSLTGVLCAIVCNNSLLNDCHARLGGEHPDLYSKCKLLPLIQDCFAAYEDTCNRDPFLTALKSEEVSLKEKCITYFGEPQSSTTGIAYVNLELETMKPMLTKPVKMLCCSNIGDGPWYIFKGSDRGLLFFNGDLRAGYNVSKFDGRILNRNCFEFTIHVLGTNEADLYECMHIDQPSQTVDLRYLLKENQAAISVPCFLLNLILFSLGKMLT